MYLPVNVQWSVQLIVNSNGKSLMSKTYKILDFLMV